MNVSQIVISTKRLALVPIFISSKGSLYISSQCHGLVDACIGRSFVSESLAQVFPWKLTAKRQDSPLAKDAWNRADHQGKQETQCRPFDDRRGSLRQYQSRTGQKKSVRQEGDTS